MLKALLPSASQRHGSSEKPETHLGGALFTGSLGSEGLKVLGSRLRV